MSTKPGLIESLFNFKDEADMGSLYHQGAASVNVYINGVPRVINVDTLMPVTKSGKLMFSEPNPKTKNCWGMILEKVWSKINSNYERTCAGW